MLDKKKWLLIFILMAKSLCMADMQTPWFGSVFQPQLNVAYTYQQYSALSGSDGPLRINTHNNFLQGDFSICLMPQWNAHLSMQLASTAYHTFYFDAATLGGCYLLLDQLEFDPFSLGLSLDLSIPSTLALTDPSFFHHSHFDAELYAILGYETSCGDQWTGHYWTNFGGGKGVEGTFWLHGRIAAEWHFLYHHHFLVGGEYYRGYGHDSLDQARPFVGYATLPYKAFDLQSQYTYQLNNGMAWSIEATRRVWSHLCPEKGYSVTFNWFCPFSF